LSDELHHECGVAAAYWLNRQKCKTGPAAQSVTNGDVAALMPSMLFNLQNRGQLAAGMSSYQVGRAQILDTFKDIGTVSEAFRMSNPDKHRAIMTRYAGRGAIGHTRYATCGADDVRHAQPFERHHGRLWKWFSFAFNGNLSNYTDLRDRILSKRDYHFTLNTDTEIVMHSLSYQLRGDKPADLVKVMSAMARTFDGAYNIVFLDGMGRMFVARDPLGLRPLNWAVQGRLFAAASESVALTNIGMEKINTLEPGEMIIIDKDGMRIERFAQSRRKAHCFFEWIYFSNVGSNIDNTSVYLARARAGQRLAQLEDQATDENSIVVPVPDTAKASADAFAYRMGIPSVEGLIRNRYVGRTFIQPSGSRGESVRYKYTPLPQILAGKKVFLVEDSIVRSTTLRALAQRIRTEGGAKEIHVRVACPPIIAPCFYGIDMSTLKELFAPKFIAPGYNGNPSPKLLAKMAKTLKVDSLRYLSVKDMGPCLNKNGSDLCTGCVTGKYPSKWGNKLMTAAKRNKNKKTKRRTYE